MAWFAWLGILVLCACGDNITGTALEDFDAETDRARCDRLVRCGLFADAATCDGFFRRHPDLDRAAAIGAGIIRYDGPSAKQCHDALAAMTCDTSAREARVLPLACDEMFRGTLIADEPCAFDEECISGACDGLVCTNECCTGFCRAARKFAELAEACTIDDDCVDDTYCAEDQRCASLVGEGGLCRSDRACEYGHGCIGPSEQMQGNCRALPLVGEACPYLRCAELGAYCKGGRCLTLGLPGSPCATLADCAPPFALCDVTSQVCIDVPTLGEPCTARCAGEAYCDTFVTNTCKSPIETGEPCRSGEECRSFYCIEGPIFSQCAELELCF